MAYPQYCSSCRTSLAAWGGPYFGSEKQLRAASNGGQPEHMDLITVSEDIAQPKCFYILDTLREKAEIPVWHDGQQGTATVTLAALINALKIVGKKMSEVKIAFIGSGHPMWPALA